MAPLIAILGACTGAGPCDDAPSSADPLPFIVFAGIVVAVLAIAGLLLWRARRL